jgi:hypothetical protein
LDLYSFGFPHGVD